MSEVAATEIAARNDAIRKRLPLTHRDDRLVITQGIGAFGPDGVMRVLAKVATFDTFTEDNDPYGEHDFGSFEFDGEKCFWKIDDYNGHEGIRCVLTVMLASEY